MKIFQSYNVLPLTAIDTPVSATNHIKIKVANISISSDDVALTFDSWLWKFNQLGVLQGAIISNMCYKFESNPSGAFWVITFKSFIPKANQWKKCKNSPTFHISEFW